MKRHQGIYRLILLLGCGLMFFVGPMPLTSMAEEQHTAVAADSFTMLADGDLNETTSLTVAILKIIGSLALVVGLMVLVLLAIKKMGLGRGSLHKNSLIKVVETRMIAPKKYITVVEIAGEYLAVGVSDQHIDLLAKISSPAAAPAGQTTATGIQSDISRLFPSLLTKAVGAFNTNRKNQAI